IPPTERRGHRTLESLTGLSTGRGAPQAFEERGLGASVPGLERQVFETLFARARWQPGRECLGLRPAGRRGRRRLRGEEHMDHTDDPLARARARSSAADAGSSPAALHRYRAVRQATEALTRGLTAEDQL